MTIVWNDSEPVARTVCISTRESADMPLMALDSQTGPSVMWHRACRGDILDHFGSAREERGGLLLGTPFHHYGNPDDLAMVEIVAAVRASESRGTAVSLEMGTQLWASARTQIARIQQQTATAHPPLMVVGWYHSHPGLGAFFSSTDRATQANFFRQHWHLGLVMDPATGDAAWFRGSDSAAVPRGSVTFI